MTIKIVADSTCDLPKDIVAEHGITIVPLYINANDRSYLDGVEMTRQEFYQRLPDFDPLPRTAAPNPEMFRQTYERLADEGAAEILSIHISISLSSTVDEARKAAKKITAIPVTVLDSQQLSLGTGFLVVAAAKAAAAGRSLAEIVELVKEMTTRTHVFAALDTVEFLRRSGRISNFASGIANLLSIKPLLKMNNGEPTSERVRTNKRAIARLIKLVSDLAPLEELALVHTNAVDRAEELRQRAAHLFPVDKIPLSVDVTPVLGAHLGPGTVGLACVAARGE